MPDQGTTNMNEDVKTLYCFGAGPVSKPTAHIAVMSGFRVVVFDTDPQYVNTENFPPPVELRVISSFFSVIRNLEITQDSYIAVVTRGHQFDSIVIEQVLQTSAGYIGLLSNTRRRDAMYEEFTDRGFPAEQLARIHSPIGLAIGGKTPDEIAVSIVAELIGVRNGMLTPDTYSGQNQILDSVQHIDKPNGPQPIVP
jgi:xanthine dehydrogenase accessory factor